MDETAFETKEERALWSTFTSLRSKIHPGISSLIIYLFKYVAPISELKFCFLPFPFPPYYVTDHVTEMEVDDFVEASFQLVHPLEDFFNHVFVMVVCFFNFIIYLCIYFCHMLPIQFLY